MFVLIELLISNCDLFISICTAGVVKPAAGFSELAKKNGARCIEINPELSEMSYLYEKAIEGRQEMYTHSFKTKNP